MNSVCSQIFDVNRTKKVLSHFLNKCFMYGKNASAAACIFDKINEKFTEYGLPWEKCVSLSVDNANAMIGRKASIASRFKQKNECCFIGSCPCHLAHIAPCQRCLQQHIGLNVEDVVIDLFYWFDKSSKRKAKLKEYHEFCNQEWREVLKHLSDRWFLLENVLTETIKSYYLKSHFESEHFAYERFQRFLSKYSNPLLDPATLFQTSGLPLFTHFNMLL